MTGMTTQPHKRYEIGVKALITDKQRLLMLRRSDFDTWEVPGGRINQDEAIETALNRELTEEILARKITIERIAHAQEADYILPNGNHLMLLFFEVSAVLPSSLMLSPEHLESRWVSSRELDDLEIQPAIRSAAQKVLETKMQKR